MVWEGRDAVKTGRSMSLLPLTLLFYDLLILSRSQTVTSATFYHNALTSFLVALLGATNPLASAPGTIRGDYAIVRLFS